MTTVWMVAFAVAGFFLTLRVFRGIITGEMVLLFWNFKRDGRETVYGCWMGFFALMSLGLFLASLKCYLGPMSF